MTSRFQAHLVIALGVMLASQARASEKGSATESAKGNPSTTYTPAVVSATAISKPLVQKLAQDPGSVAQVYRTSGKSAQAIQVRARQSMQFVDAVNNLGAAPGDTPK